MAAAAGTRVSRTLKKPRSSQAAIAGCLGSLAQSRNIMTGEPYHSGEGGGILPHTLVEAGA